MLDMLLGQARESPRKCAPADRKSLCKLSCIEMNICALNWLNTNSIAIKSDFVSSD